MSDSKTKLPNWHGALIVSCQPIPKGPFDTPEMIAAFAAAAESNGAAALRIEGVDNVRYIVDRVSIPVIGIVKRDLLESPVRITPLLEDVAGLVDAGASIIAVDATARPRPVPSAALFEAVNAAGRLAMADISTLEEGFAAARDGATLIASTLAGYTDGGEPVAPNLDLVRALVSANLPTIAEGNYRTPELAAQACAAGALAVTVGSAITRPEHIIQWYAESTAAAGSTIV